MVTCLSAMDSALCLSSRIHPIGIRVGFHSVESRGGLLPDLAHR